MLGSCWGKGLAAGGTLLVMGPRWHTVLLLEEQFLKVLLVEALADRETFRWHSPGQEVDLVGREVLLC